MLPAYVGIILYQARGRKQQRNFSSFEKMVPIVLGATGVLRLAELSRPNQRRRND